MTKAWKDIEHKKDIPTSGTGGYYNIKDYEEKQMEKSYDLNLTVAELNLVLGALGKLSFEVSAPVIQVMQVQVKAQDSAAEKLAEADGNIAQGDSEGEA